MFLLSSVNMFVHRRTNRKILESTQGASSKTCSNLRLLLLLAYDGSLPSKKYRNPPAEGGSIGTWKTEVVSTWNGKNLLYVEKSVSLQYVEFPFTSVHGKIQKSSKSGKKYFLLSSLIGFPHSTAYTIQLYTYMPQVNYC